MRKVLTLALATLGVAAGVRGVEPRLWEDFERADFPPPGWHTEGKETAWTRGAGTNNHYARGNLVVERGTSWASLVTRNFALKTSGQITLRLHYIAGLQGDGEGKRTVTLRRGTNELWKTELTAPWSWTKLKVTLGPYRRGDNYNLEFKVTGAASTIATVWLYVDNLHVRECETAVEPTSLGRVKALYY
ncbi:MAG: hypothetical protein JSU81_06825 [Candidatus Coatesbacteria bacterium]|nr:MAG: hypothetical protein JSU81_06825 [Candidatus Coatesbacteria bacterium]